MFGYSSLNSNLIANKQSWLWIWKDQGKKKIATHEQLKKVQHSKTHENVI